MTQADRTAISDDHLISSHRSDVRRIAYSLSRTMPHVEMDDLMQAGMVGLLSAAQCFSTAKGASFGAYAAIRIRGAILDEARRASMLPRSKFRDARQLADAAQTIQNETGCRASTAEVADSLGVPMERYHKMVLNAANGHPVSFERWIGGSEGPSLLPESTEESPEEAADKNQKLEALTRAIEALPEQDQLILSLYYYEGLNLREIDDVLGLCESRIHQIRGRILQTLRSHVTRLMSCWPRRKRELTEGVSRSEETRSP